jgi:hypothetical protein
MHRAFNDFAQAERSAEAFAGEGFVVELISATGRFLMGYGPGMPHLPDQTGRSSWPEVP